MVKSKFPINTVALLLPGVVAFAVGIYPYDGVGLSKVEWALYTLIFAAAITGIFILVANFIISISKRS